MMANRHLIIERLFTWELNKDSKLKLLEYRLSLCLIQAWYPAIPLCCVSYKDTGSRALGCFGESISAENHEE